jgi:hypothetical protein
MKAHDVYLKFRNEDDVVVWVSVSDIIQVGNPIDENGIDMEQDDDLVYHWINGSRGWAYYPIN